MAYMVVLVATSSREEAEKIVDVLLKEKLIACANVLGPVSSSFWWKGKVDHTEEYIVFMKTEERMFEDLVESVRRVHSYEVPEIIALPIIKGFKPYLEWIGENIKSGG